MINEKLNRTVLHNIIKYANEQFRLEQNKKITKDMVIYRIKDKIKKEVKENAN